MSDLKNIPPKDFARLYPIFQKAKVGECPYAEIATTSVCVCNKDNTLCYACEDCPIKKSLLLTDEELKIRYKYWNTQMQFGIYKNWTILQLFCDKLDFLYKNLIQSEYLYNRPYESLKHLSFEIINAYIHKSNILIKENKNG